MSTTVATYDIGDRVILSSTFRVDDVLTDPTTVVFTVRREGASAVTYTYGTDARVVKTATGTFTCWVEPDVAGDWYYAVDGTGAAKGGEEHLFRVREPLARG